VFALALVLVLVGPRAGLAQGLRGESFEEGLARAASPGEVVWLEAGGQRSLALYREARSGRPAGAVLIAHGLGRHADQAGVVAELRRRLPDDGWHTLSVQLPAPSAGAPAGRQGEVLDGALARITAGQRYLAQRGIRNVVLVGHRWGAGQLALFLEAGIAQGVTGYAAIAPSYPAPGPTRERAAAILDGAGLPRLEIVATQAMEADAPSPRAAVGESARGRVIIDSADVTLDDSADAVLKRLRAWLARYGAGAGRRGP
jgi:hypothetical protein